MSSEKEIDLARRRFLFRATSLVGGIGVIAGAVPFLSSLLPKKAHRVKSSTVEVDVSQLKPGERMTVEWQGKPVWIIRRTPEMLALLQEANPDLRDPNSKVEQQPVYAKNVDRSLKPDYLVIIGLCTHLGCVPDYMPKPGSVSPKWRGGFYCPCHGSEFDLSGRVYVGMPAPVNLEVPPYQFITPTRILIGKGPGGR